MHGKWRSSESEVEASCGCATNATRATLLSEAKVKRHNVVVASQNLTSGWIRWL